MASAMDDRFVEKIPWIAFQNNSSQTIPPFSVITGSWQFSDVSGNSVTVQEPMLLATQPVAPINPWLLYVTNDIQVAAGDYGECARPDVYPQLASVGSFSSSGVAVGAICGATTNNFNMTPGAPGFVIVATASKNGYAFVQTTRGPYAGQLSRNQSNTMGAITVNPMNGQTASSVNWPVNNPWANIDTTLSSANLNCLFDWIPNQSQWQLIVAVPTCPNASSGGS